MGWLAGVVSARRIGSAGIRATLLAALLLLNQRIERVVYFDGTWSQHHRSPRCSG